MRLLVGDTFYRYQCDYCSESDIGSLQRLSVTWNDIQSVLKTDVAARLKANWGLFFALPPETDDWEQELKKAPGSKTQVEGDVGPDGALVPTAASRLFSEPKKARKAPARLPANDPAPSSKMQADAPSTNRALGASGKETAGDRLLGSLPKLPSEAAAKQALPVALPPTAGAGAAALDYHGQQQEDVEAGLLGFKSSKALKKSLQKLASSYTFSNLDCIPAVQAAADRV